MVYTAADSSSYISTTSKVLAIINSDGIVMYFSPSIKILLKHLIENLFLFNFFPI